MPRRVAQYSRPQGARLANERFGADEVSQTQPRKERFRKAANVNDPSIGIQRLERRGRGFQKGHLEFVVVLHDQCVHFPCPVQEGAAARDRHGRCRGALVAGRGKDYVCLRRDNIRWQSVLIDAHRCYMATRMRENIAQGRVAWIFEHGAPPLCQKHLRRQP